MRFFPARGALSPLPVATILLTAVCLALPVPVLSGGANWRDHESPFDFLFGNHLDTHQQTRLTQAGGLDGWLYVTFTGEIAPGGYPVARHCNENTPASECVFAWTLAGTPCIEAWNGCRAELLYHAMDHPVWLIDSRTSIPQPGAPSHFHWLSADNSLGIPVPEACDVEMAGQLTPGIVCPGFFLELRSVDSFAFRHAGADLPVDPGLDISTHLNLVTSFPDGGCGGGGCGGGGGGGH